MTKKYLQKQEEIVEKRNTALAFVVGAMCLGIAIIVAASVHGG